MFYLKDFFFPNLGTNIALLTKSVLLVDITKTLYDNRVELNLSTMMDQIHSGKLIELGFGYDINDKQKIQFSAQHMSNGSLCDPNQGLTTVGIRFAWKID